MNTQTIIAKNKKKAALIAALGLLIMTIFAGIAFGMIHSNLVVMSNSEETFNNLLGQSNQFNFEILAWMMILILDIVVAFAFYYFFASTNMQLALFSATLRIIYTLFLSAGIYQLIQIAINIKNAYSSTEVMHHLVLFDKFWSRGLIIFGLHLIIVALLMFKTPKIPKFLSALMLFAGLCYFSVHTLYLIAPSLDLITHSIENKLAFPMAIGELSFALWLFIRGIRKPFLDTAQ